MGRVYSLGEERFGEESRILKKNSCKTLEISRLVLNLEKGPICKYAVTCVATLFAL